MNLCAGSEMFVGTMPDASQSRLCYKTAVIATAKQHIIGGAFMLA